MDCQGWSLILKPPIGTVGVTERPSGIVRDLHNSALCEARKDRTRKDGEGCHKTAMKTTRQANAEPPANPSFHGELYLCVRSLRLPGTTPDFGS